MLNCFSFAYLLVIYNLEKYHHTLISTMDFFAQNYDFLSLTRLTLNGSYGNIELKSRALFHAARLKI